MGLGGEAPDAPTIPPTPQPDDETAPEPDGPEAASRQGERRGRDFTVKAPSGGLTLNTREPCGAGVKNPEAREGAAFRGHLTGYDNNRQGPTEAGATAVPG
jgi:hypothetical protein